MSGLFVLTFGLGCVFGTIQIIGGTETTIENFPYQISLNYKGQHVCGGAIISQSVVVTAAQCVYGIPHCRFEVQAGCTRLSDRGVRIAVKKVIPHEDYTMFLLKNDIALVILAEPLQFSKFIRPIALIENGQHIFSDKDGIASGWGNFCPGVPESDVLQYIAYKWISYTDCQEFCRKNAVEPSKRYVCAKVPEGESDPCREPGAPVLSGGKLAAIVSWGAVCGDKKSPRVHTRIIPYLGWIRYHSAKNKL